MRRIHRTLPAVLLLSMIAVAQTAPTLQTRPAAKPAAALAVTAVLPSEETVNAFLFQMFGYDPTVTWKVGEIRPSEIPGLAEVTITVNNAQGSNQNRLLISSDGKHAITGDVLPFGAKPFEDARAKLEKGVNGPAKGPAKAPVTIVEFSDMQCPHCAKAAPGIEQLLAQQPEVRFIFQNFPLPMHDWAEKAADYVDCVGRASNDAVWKFIQKTFDDQANITASNADEKLKAIATASGANGDEIAACAAKGDTIARVQTSLALGRSVGVTGTPTLFVNGRNVPGGAPVEVLKKIVDFEASQK
ncbi:MAG TPA: thioredoxin domain-containing protein [Terriglobales bacterium]|jgi:protein-disulfide isomerase|nr:thioredoxin domain-containing protein [Terriglobales bacterium]